MGVVLLTPVFSVTCACALTGSAEENSRTATERGAVTFKRMNSRSLANGAVVLEVTVDVRRWDEKAGLRQDAISSQVIDALESARDKGDRQ